MPRNYSSTLPKVPTFGECLSPSAVLIAHISPCGRFVYSKLQKNVPEFHAKKFPPIANEVFTSFLEAHRTGDLFALAGLTTDQMYTTIKVTDICHRLALREATYVGYCCAFRLKGTSFLVDTTSDLACRRKIVGGIRNTLQLNSPAL